MVSFVSVILFSLTERILLTMALNTEKMCKKNIHTREVRDRRGGAAVDNLVWYDGEKKKLIPRIANCTVKLALGDASRWRTLDWPY